MAHEKFQKLLTQFDSLIKSGHTAECKKQFSKIKVSHIPRNLRSDFAKISSRLNWPTKSYQLLRDIVFTKKVNIKPTDSERLQMGMALRQLGALAYAERVFNQVSSEHLPEVLLYQAAIKFNMWDYQAAVPIIQKFIDHPKISEQQRLIGLVNLCAALVYLKDLNNLKTVLPEAKQIAGKLNHDLFMANLLEIEAQSLFFSQNFAAALKLLAQAQELIKDDTSIYKLFIGKWVAIIHLKMNMNSENLNQLNLIRNKAMDLKHWETVRDCDFYFATIKNDEYLFKRVYFGTPFEQYRQRLFNSMPIPVKISNYFYWSGNFPYAKLDITSTQQLDLTTPEVQIGGHSFDQFHSYVQILKCLCTDFYTPIKPVNIYLALYPKELNDPEKAIQRVFNAVSKLNILFVKEKIPLVIDFIGDGYRINFISPLIIIVPEIIDLSDRNSFFKKELHRQFLDSTFSTTEVSKTLKIPKRTALRFIKNALDNKELKQFGSGTKVKYQIIK